jgi:hypothetical protein
VFPEPEAEGVYVMRFNTVEVERAYMDYLDSLDDWPPPQGSPVETMGALTQTPDDPLSLFHPKPATNALNS